MKDRIISRYWGAVWATIALIVYFLWASDRSNSGEADRNIVFYIGGCIIYFVTYMLAERICCRIEKTDMKGIWCACIVIAGMAVIWMLCSYVNDPALFPSNVWGMHDFPILLHFILLIGMTYFGSMISANANRDSKVRNTKLRIAVVAVVMVVQVSLLYAPNVWLDEGGGIYHVHAYTNSIINTLSHQPFDESNYSIYGHYALFYGVVVKVLHTVLGTSNLMSIILAICLVGAVAFSVSFYLLDKLIEKDAAFCISVVAFSVISTFCYGAGQYYQVLPHRIVFQVLALYGAYYVIYVKRSRALLWVIGMCAVIWNIEIGLICCAAYFVLESWFDIEKILKEKKYLRIVPSIIKNLIFMIFKIASAYIVVNIYNICCGGIWNSVETFILPLTNPNYMLGSLPSPLPDVFAGYFLEILLFMGMLCYCANILITLRDEEEINRNKYIFMIFNSLVGLGSLTYYMNRAARANLYIAHVELIILLAVLIDQNTIGLKIRYRDFSTKHVKSVIKIFAMLLLMSLVIDSAGDARKAFDQRIRTSWNTATMDEFCKSVKETVPEGTRGFGLSVPELYSAIDRDTGIYVGDWSDYNLFDMSKMNDIMMNSDQLFAHKGSFETYPNYVDYICRHSYEITGGGLFGLYVKNVSRPAEGNYIITAKQDNSLGICTDGSSIFLGNDALPVGVAPYELVIGDNSVLDVPAGRVDENGRIQLWESNGTESQKWFIEPVDEYYLISWYEYSLTYDVNDKSIRLAPTTGEENQLWSFTN